MFDTYKGEICLCYSFFKTEVVFFLVGQIVLFTLTFYSLCIEIYTLFLESDVMEIEASTSGNRGLGLIMAKGLFFNLI